MFAMLRQPTTEPHDFLYIDPVAVMMLNGLSSTAVTTIELLVNYDIMIPAKFTAKLTYSRLDTRRSRHPIAVNHVPAAEYTDPGQLGVRDRPVTEEERARQNPKGDLQIEAMPSDGMIRAKQTARIKT